MLNKTTITKLNEMRLTTMAESLRHQLQDPSFNDLGFEERLGLMVDAEWARRKNNMLTRLIRKADLHLVQACIEDIEYHADRKLDKAQITRLSTLHIHFRRNTTLSFSGLPGLGRLTLVVRLELLPAANSTP